MLNKNVGATQTALLPTLNQPYIPGLLVINSKEVIIRILHEHSVPLLATFCIHRFERRNFCQHVRAPDIVRPVSTFRYYETSHKSHQHRSYRQVP